MGRGQITKLVRVNPLPARRADLPRKRGRCCGAFGVSPHHIRGAAGRDQLARVVHHLGMRDRDAVAEAHHAPGGEEMIAAAGTR